MEKLISMLVFLFNNYPENFKNELSKARVTKMIYLTDWLYALNSDKHHQITPIKWYFNNYGPYSDDVINCVKKYPNVFGEIQTETMYGSPKTLISLITPPSNLSCLEELEIKCLRKTIEMTKPLLWDDFIELIYSTYPIQSSNKYVFLDLTQKAEELIKLRQEQAK